ncbi:hypothetical protein SLS54_008114 [Diplodia seriata]
MSSNTVVLITGVNRGIGHALFAAYLARPHHTVIGGVRDPSSPSSQSLSALPRGTGSAAIIVKLDSASPTDALAAISFLQTAHSITKLDTVIANAGIQKALPWVRDVTAASLQVHFLVNVIGPVLLFQAALPLLDAAADAGGPPPRFVTVGSAGGSIALTGELPFPNAAYGPGKAALHYLTRKIDDATREKTSGRLMVWDGTELPW